MKVLITGGAGFIGSNLVETLISRDPSTEIVVLDDLTTGRKDNLQGLDVTFLEGSILSMDQLAEAVDGVDAVVHLAAIGSVALSVEHPRRAHDANATGTLNVLEAARLANVNQVIVASSSSVYGSNEAMPKSEFDWTRPMSPYAASKLATESYAIAYGHSYGIKTLALRFFNVYGPRQQPDHDYAAVIPRFLDAALHGERLTIHGDGLQSRDFTYVASVCDAIALSLEKSLHFDQPINLAFGTNTTLLELVSEIESILGRQLTVEHTPLRPGDVRASQSDGKRIRELFPELQPVPLPEGLKATAAWLASNQPLD